MGRSNSVIIFALLAVAALGAFVFWFLNEPEAGVEGEFSSSSETTYPGTGAPAANAGESASADSDQSGTESAAGLPAERNSRKVLLARGRVLSESGDPILHAVVLGEQYGRRRPLHAEVDAKGSFKLQGQALALSSLRVVAKGYGSRRLGRIPLGEDLVVVLTEAASFQGRVMRAPEKDGEKPSPLRGASVTVRPIHAATNEDLQVTTDAKGRFSFEAMAPGRWNVFVTAEGLAPVQDNRIEFQPAATFERDYELGAGITLRGFATTDGTKTRLRNVRIEALTMWEQTTRAGHRRRLGPVITNEEGKFTLRGLEPGPLLILARGRGYASWFKEVQVSKDVGDITINLPPRIQIAGRVLDPSGNARPGMRVSIKPKDIALHQFKEIAPFLFGLENWSDAMGPKPAYVTTNRDGRFKLDSAPPIGACEIIAHDPQASFAPSQTKVVHLNRPLPESIDLSLRPGTSVSGFIKDEDGHPVEGAQIWLAGIRDLSDPKGAFELHGVAAGKQMAAVKHPGFSYWRMPVTVPKSGLRGVPVTLLSGRQLSGRVQDLRGRPVIAAWAVLFDRTRSQPVKLATQRTDVAGRFSFGGLKHGKLQLLINAPGCEGVIMNDLVPSTNFQELSIEVSPAQISGVGDISGRVVDDATGEPLKQYSLPTHQGFDIERDGEAFIIRNAVAGPQYIQVKAQGYQGVTIGPRELSPGSVLDLGTLRLGQAFQLTVHVSDPHGKPAKGVKVYVEDLEIPKLNSAQALKPKVSPRAPHFFSWQALRKGRYKFVFYGDKWRTLEHTLRLDAGNHVQLKLSPK